MAKVAGGVMMVAESMLPFGAVDSVIVPWMGQGTQAPPTPFLISPQGNRRAEGAIPVLEDSIELTTPGALHYITCTGFFDATKAFSFKLSGTYDVVGDAVDCEGCRGHRCRLVRYPVIIAWGRGCCQPLGCGLIGLSWVSRWDFGLTLTS